MDEIKPESAKKEEINATSSPGPRRRGRPRGRAFVKVETVAVEKPVLPEPRWMAEFVAVFLKASR